MSESVFLNVIRGNRMQLQMSEGFAVRNAKDYAYCEVPVEHFYNTSTEGVQTKAIKGQHIQVIPACKIQLDGKYRILVKTNPELQKVATCPTMFLLDLNEGEQPSFYATFRKDFELAHLDWAVRLYVLA